MSEKMLNFISFQGNANLKHNDTIVRISRASEDAEHLLALSSTAGCNWYRSRATITTSYDPEIPLLRLCPRAMYMPACQKICTRMATATVFIIASK